MRFKAQVKTSEGTQTLLFDTLSIEYMQYEDNLLVFNNGDSFTIDRSVIEQIWESMVTPPAS